MATIIEQKNDKIDQFMDDAEKDAVNAYWRWYDEKEYENIEDYEVLFRPHIEKMGWEFVKMTKRPLGCRFKIDETELQFGVTQSKIYVRAVKPARERENGQFIIEFILVLLLVIIGAYFFDAINIENPPTDSNAINQILGGILAVVLVGGGIFVLFGGNK